MCSLISAMVSWRLIGMVAALFELGHAELNTSTGRGSWIHVRSTLAYCSGCADAHYEAAGLSGY
jgi:hypothetical protein